MENLLHELACFVIIILQLKKNGPRNTEVLYLTKLSIRNEGESKTFPAKQRLKNSLQVDVPALCEMLKGIQAEMKGH